MSYPNQITTIELQYPVTFDGKEIKELSVRRPLVRDQLIAGKSSDNAEDKEIKLLSLLAGVDADLIQILDLSDYFSLLDVVVGFGVGKSQKK